MGNKNRLFEVFSIVNKININEEILNTDDVQDQIIDDVKFNFDGVEFRDGVPSELKYNILGQDIVLNILENENGLKLVDVNQGGQKRYVATYGGLLKYGENDLKFNLSIEIYVDVEPVYTFEKFEFKTEILVDKNDIEINFIQ